MKVGVLMGGPSSERAISLLSGKAIYRALKSQGYNCVAIDIGEDAYHQIKASRIDVAFIALHGRFGEDGTIQAMLEEMGVPYTGSGPQASRLGMDKVASRKLFQQKNIPVPNYIVLRKNPEHLPASNSSLGNHASSALAASAQGGTPRRGTPSDYEAQLSALRFPLVVKPSSHGSSIGLSIVEDELNLSEAIEGAYRYDDVIIIEEYIRGKELTVGILDEEPLPVIWLIPKRKFFDYRSKYEEGMTLHIVPAPLPEDTYLKVQMTGLKAHKALGCRDFSRVDMYLDEDQRPIVLEVNTIPGFTATSLLPKAAEAEGYSFKELCKKLLELALRRRANMGLQAMIEPSQTGESR